MTVLRIFQKGFNYSQDGPGNRLVYHLQGCNLRCPWCSNPEGLSPAGGKVFSVEELTHEAIGSSLMFFDGGGVTLTGGEVTMQLPAVKEFLTCLHEARIHTCIETNGISPDLSQLFPVLDLLIMDVKHYDAAKHRTVIGTDNAMTLQNVALALEMGQKTLLRIPLVGGFNASETDARQFALLFRRMGVPGRADVELLRYHEYGAGKYQKLGLPYTMEKSAQVSQGACNRYEIILRQAGVHTVHT